MRGRSRVTIYPRIPAMLPEDGARRVFTDLAGIACRVVYEELLTNPCYCSLVLGINHSKSK